jgi:uncharacterized protein with NAD-binding domain and iron-sulfur cluster
MKKPKTVVIVGGGIAGLSAAHELVRRGFDVHLYERRAHLGGKAASVTIAKGDAHGRDGLPGEHGFRFFPGWYRHLPKTMEKIPYRNRTVADNLVAVDTNLLGSYQREPVRALLRLPTNLKDISTITGFFDGLLSLGISIDDLKFFMGKLWEFLTSSEERRVAEYDNKTWWDFMEADKRSQAFRDYLVIAVTRSTVAANPRQASAYTIAKMAIQTVIDSATPTTPADRVLNGPTQEVFIRPWVEYLTEQGVTFHLNAELDSIEFHPSKPEIKELKFSFNAQAIREAKIRWETAARRHDAALARLRELGVDPAAALADQDDRKANDPAIEAELPKVLNPSDDGSQAQPKAWVDDFAGVLLAANDVAILGRWARWYFERYQELVEKAQAQTRERVLAHYYVLALPIEQMAYQVQISEGMQRIDSSLNRIIRLSEHVDWMAGIQFYLTEKLEITRGHIACLDSPWQLTAIEQVQFWPDIDVEDRNPGRVKAILSVDISAWDTKGDNGIEAFNCKTNGEIAEEVWHQLEQTLNRPGQAPVLRKEWLLDYNGQQDVIGPGSYHLDDNIVDRFDRKKQAVYDKAQTVRFDAARLIERQKRQGRVSETPYAYGQRMRINAEPLLINRAGGLALRPAAKTKVTNMFLAGDYVATMTNLATMEGANEAARVAVNEIVLASGVQEPLCDLFPLKEPMELFRSIDEILFKKKQRFEDTYADIPVRIVAGAASAATNMLAKTLGKVLDRRRQP